MSGRNRFDALRAVMPTAQKKAVARKGAAAAQPSYTLAELLAASGHTAPLSAEERAWIDAPPVGKEI